MYTDNLIPPSCHTLLTEAGLDCPDPCHARLARFRGLLTEWNPVAALVASRELDKLPEHIADSLSLAPYVAAVSQLVDIGSGGGFPAVPLKCVLPDLKVSLFERNERKASFLRKVGAALEFTDWNVSQGDFRVAEAFPSPSVWTARAVERPETMLPAILERMVPKDQFLCQSEEITQLGPILDRFNWREILDPWTDCGLRRGRLFLLTPLGKSASKEVSQ